MVSSTPNIWTVTNGNIVELKDEALGVVPVEPPVPCRFDMATEAYLEAYTRLYAARAKLLSGQVTATLVEPVSTPSLTPIAPGPAPTSSQERSLVLAPSSAPSVDFEEPSLLEGLQPPKQTPSEARRAIEAAKTKHGRPPARIFDPAQYFMLPDRLVKAAGNCRKVEREAADAVYRRLIDAPGRALKAADLDPLWQSGWHTNTVRACLSYWREVGVVEQNQPRYAMWRLVEPKEMVLTYTRRKNTVRMHEAREFLWVPEATLRSAIAALEKDGRLAKHPRKEEWLPNRPPTQLSGATKMEEPKANGGGGTGASIPMQVKLPPLSDYSVVRQEGRCTSCNHQYFYFFRAGTSNLCGGCFKRMGATLEDINRAKSKSGNVSGGNEAFAPKRT